MGRILKDTLIKITKNRKKPQEPDKHYSNHGRDEQGLGSHRPYAGSTLAGETRVVAIKFQKYSSREVALEASRLGSHRPYAGSTSADARTRVAATKDPKLPSRGVALEASRFFDRYF